MNAIRIVAFVAAALITAVLFREIAHGSTIQPVGARISKVQ
jgi:hypothetical protein